jgi:hypothetical protein
MGAAIADVRHGGKGDQENQFGLFGGHMDMAYPRRWLHILLDGRLQDGNRVAADFFKSIHSDSFSVLESGVAAADAMGSVSMFGIAVALAQASVQALRGECGAGAARLATPGPIHCFQ